MYLPLTGYRDKDSFEERMSINSISPSNNASVVKALDPGAAAQEKMEEINHQQKQEQSKPEDLTEDQKSKAVEGFYSAGSSMSTQDFTALRTQASEGTYEVLDRAISKMKENVEAVGDAIETISEMAKKTSKDNIALQVLQKTLDAMDKAQGGE
jgi:molecular chaperone GrpE (heat shock protein)